MPDELQISLDPDVLHFSSGEDQLSPEEEWIVPLENEAAHLEPDGLTDPHVGADPVVVTSVESYYTLWDPQDDPQPDSETVDTDGTVDRTSRAEQVAIELGLAYGWGTPGIGVLTRVFCAYGWSRTKESMERELECGLTPEDLELALATREIWDAHRQFASSSDYDNLSWPLALRLVRSFGSVPDPTEIETFLVEAYNAWRSRVIRSYEPDVGFAQYVDQIVQMPDESSLTSPIVLVDLEWEQPACDTRPRCKPTTWCQRGEYIKLWV